MTEPQLQTGLFIDGRFTPSASGRTFETTNPATGESLAHVAEAGREDLDLAVAAARKAFESGPWAAMKPRQRGRILLRAAELLSSRADAFGRVETLDNGKPIFESALAIERELQQLLFQSDDAKEGIAANQEKRVPKFKAK